jgi:polyketide cyclase/dehydrase/lipid transport protein
MRIESSTIINRPVDEVFRFQADEHYSNHPHWDPAVVSLKPIGSGPARLGSRFELKRRMLGREQTDIFEIVEWDSPHRVAIETRSPGFRLRITAICEAVSADRTRLVVAGDATLGGVRALVGPLIRPKLARQARGNIARIKELIEAARPA